MTTLKEALETQILYDFNNGRGDWFVNDGDDEYMVEMRNDEICVLDEGEIVARFKINLEQLE